MLGEETNYQWVVKKESAAEGEKSEDSEETAETKEIAV
jgi:hypothetical protein